MTTNVKFKSYEIKNNNPFERLQLQNEKFIFAEVDSDGLYTLHLRFENGLGISSVEKLPLQDAAALAFGYAKELNYDEKAVWIDLPEHVLDQPIILNRKIKKVCKKLGLKT